MSDVWEDMLTMRPPSGMRGSTFWIIKNGTFAFTFMTSSKSASLVSSIVPRRQIPALFTRMSTVVVPRSVIISWSRRTKSASTPAGDPSSDAAREIAPPPAD